MSITVCYYYTTPEYAEKPTHRAFLHLYIWHLQVFDLTHAPILVGSVVNIEKDTG